MVTHDGRCYQCYWRLSQCDGDGGASCEYFTPLIEDDALYVPPEEKGYDPGTKFYDDYWSKQGYEVFDSVEAFIEYFHGE